MPTVRDFGAYKVMLYAEDHNPPHVHVIGTDFQAKVRIRDAAVFVGSNSATPSAGGIGLDCSQPRPADGKVE